MRRLLMVVAVGSALLAACASDSGTSGPTSPTASESSSSESPSPAAPSPSESPLPPLPPAVESVMHGGTYFGVYLAVGEAGDPALTAAVEQANALGYQAFPGDIACDQGAAEALGVADNLMAVAIYFEQVEQANDLIPWLHQPPLGVVRVQTYCAD
ncbi:MAG: hypothetical protein AB1551_00305 [Actinomycetota bacterium]